MQKYLAYINKVSLFILLLFCIYKTIYSKKKSYIIANL